MSRTTWDALNLLKHHLQEVRNTFHAARQTGLYAKLNTCIELVDTVILGTDEGERDGN